MKPQDFERLSAYIDNQLAPGEKAALEQRLAREPELRDALRELRLTVKAVRTLPTVKPPRNFTLTPAQAGLPAGGRAPRRGGLFPTLRLAASLSAVALAIVVGGDLAATQGLLRTAAPAQEVASTTTVEEPIAAQAEALTATPEAELSVMSAEAAPTETLIAETVPVGAGGGVTATDEPTPGAVAALLPATPTLTPSAERSAAATPADETVAADAATTDLYQATESTKSLPPADETLTALYAAGTPPAEAPAPAPAAPGFPPLRVLEAALAMLTVLLGLGAYLASRNP
jgi:hypothetical protein